MLRDRLLALLGVFENQTEHPHVEVALHAENWEDVFPLLGSGRVNRVQHDSYRVLLLKGHPAPDSPIELKALRQLRTLQHPRVSAGHAQQSVVLGRAHGRVQERHCRAVRVQVHHVHPLLFVPEFVEQFVRVLQGH